MRKRHRPEQIVKTVRGANAMPNVGKSPGEVLQVLEVSEAAYHHSWRNQFDG